MSIRKVSVRLTAAVGVAALLWFVMFSPWTSGAVNFWIMMSLSAVVLTTLVIVFSDDRRELLKVEKPGLQLLLGIALAFALWGIFYVGDKLSGLMFGFARSQVDSVYAMKSLLPSWIIALLLLFLIGPAEELFWRGYVQKSANELFADSRTGARFVSFALTTLIYALIHVWSFNFMLVMAAAVAGAVWGLIYMLRPRLLPALVISHAIWDALVFVIMPI